MKRWAVAVAGAALVLAGCSASDQAPSTTPTAPEPTPSAATASASTGQPSTSPSADAGASGAPCPSGQPAGSYRLTGFAGQSQSGLGHGTGGDVTVTFTDGTYRMVAKGDEPMIMEIPDQASGKLYVKGTIDGSYDKSGAVRTFTVGSAKGTAYLTNAEGRAEVEFGQLTKVIGLDGEFAVACQGDRLALAGEAAVFSLVRT
jgi:hypothetical protein